MSAYLKFFELDRSPFEGEAQSKVVLGTRALREALTTIQSGLDAGDARICVSGGPGLGKTSLARALPKLLADPTRVAVVLNPSGSWDTLRNSLARQWQLPEGGLARGNLLAAALERRLVLVIDQAENASADLLDHLDVLLSYRTDQDEPVVQSVLFANLSSRESGEPPPLVWWLDRIQTLQLVFPPLPLDGIGSYIEKHLKRAGWTGNTLFSSEAVLAIHGHTGGIPGDVGQACERLLEEAASRDRAQIDASFVHEILDGPPEPGAPSHEDEFEELILEGEFKGANNAAQADSQPSPDASASSPQISGAEHETSDPDDPVLAASAQPSEDLHDAESTATIDLGEPLDAAEAPAQTPLSDLEEYLSRPPTEEELRMIEGGGRIRTAFVTAALILAVTLGGITVAWIRGDDPPRRSENPEAITPDRTDRADATPDGVSRGGTEPTRPAEAAPAVLGRLRGPVPETESLTFPEPRLPDSPNAALDSPTPGRGGFPAAAKPEGNDRSEPVGRPHAR
jgi:type II secretory pathway predicted ATPase ExeA